MLPSLLTGVRWRGDAAPAALARRLRASAAARRVDVIVLGGC
jgi:hypothetical protein